MTVSTTQVIDEYTGNSSTTVFAYTSKIFATTDLQVYVNSVLQTLTTHYTVSGVGTATGGNVTFVTAPGGVLVRIVKAIPQTQSTDYVENDPFPAASFEDALDRLTLLVQQVDEITDRAPKFATSSSTRNITFPEGTSAADRANKLVRWNSAGTDLVVTAAGSLGTLVVGVDVFTQRTITADSNIAITNGSGVSGNPTVRWTGMDFAAAGTVEASRATLNVIAGSGISVAVQTNPAGTGRADLYISSRGIAIGEAGTPVGTRQFLNFIEGTSVNVTVTDNAAGTGRVDVTISSSAAVSAATQAEMEAASSTTVYASPGRMLYAPGMSKVWGRWNNAGTIAASENISSITDTGVGEHAANLTTSFSSGNYASFSGSGDPVKNSSVNSQVANQIAITGRDTLAQTAADLTNWTAVAYGDQ